LRHASAEDASCRVNDLNRRLSEVGRAEAAALGRFVRNREITFDRVICSTATRARETMSLVIGKTSQASFDQRVYEAKPTDLIDLLREVPEGAKTVLLVGHNPSLEQMAGMITGVQVSMAAGTLLKIDVEGNDWSFGDVSRCNLDWLMRPADL